MNAARIAHAAATTREQRQRQEANVVLTHFDADCRRVIAAWSADRTLRVTANRAQDHADAIKAAAHWLTSGLPLVLAAPFLGLMVGLDPETIGLTTLTLAIGTPALTLIGAIGAALVAGLRRGGLLLAVIVLPLSVPVLIFGVGATAATSGPAGTATQPLLILAGLALALTALAPIAGAAALRDSLSD